MNTQVTVKAFEPLIQTSPLFPRLTNEEQNYSFSKVMGSWITPSSETHSRSRIRLLTVGQFDKRSRFLKYHLFLLAPLHILEVILQIPSMVTFASMQQRHIFKTK